MPQKVPGLRGKCGMRAHACTSYVYLTAFFSSTLLLVAIIKPHPSINNITFNLSTE